MTVVIVRGTGGSGKSTLVRQIMACYETKVPELIEGRKQPLSYTLSSPDKKDLYVPGHYETACGGLDTLPTLDLIFSLIRRAHTDGKHVLCEGMLLASDVKRSLALAAETNDVVMISLTTPIEQCCDNIRKRRAEKGNAKELNEANTRRRYDYEQKQVKKLTEAGVDIRTLVFDDALETIRRLFHT